MCGIIGCNWEDKSLIKRGLKVIEHRGPDDVCEFFDRGISLGHRRLSILDLSEQGRQPMSNKEETIWIIFNGEIYNYQELRAGLRHGHEFKSDTDTEVLIHLYEEKGVEMLKELNGMFAFCIYDAKKKILFIARDRVGIKPLYYYEKDKKFIFCSEMKGILEDKEIKREVNKDALSLFLTFRANTGEESILKDIKKLMPGCFMIYDMKKKKLDMKKYWKIMMSEENESKEYFKKELLSLMADSVKKRLIADVPYGAYLSGGVDSGTIVSLMNNYAEGKVKTFSVGFAEEEGDTELSAAAELAARLGTKHHELLIDRKAIKRLPDIVYHGDEPMADPTAIPTYLLSEYTKKKGVTVVLTGEGADELFAGYPQYKFMKRRQGYLDQTPIWMRKTLPFVLKHTPSFLLNKGFKFASALGEKGIERFENFLLTDDKAEQYLQQVSIFNEKEQEELLDIQGLYKRYAKYFKGGTVLSNCQKIDFRESMVDDLLMKVDKNTMAFGVEARVPFLDHRIVELASKMPNELKLKGYGGDKDILRETMKNLVPNVTRKRKKRHFFVPIDNWFDDELANLTRDLLLSTHIEKQKIFNPRYIEKIWDGFNKSKLYYSRQLWCLLTFQIWYKRYIENEKIKI